MNVKVCSFPEYNTPAPGKACGRWGHFRRGYPVAYRGRIGVYVCLERIPFGPAGVHARNFARAYGRDALVAFRAPSGAWDMQLVPMAEICPVPEGMLYDGPLTLTIDDGE